MPRTARPGRLVVAGALATVCLGFTRPPAAWADESHSTLDVPLDVRRKWVDDPYSAHDTTGTLVRFGTLVGIVPVDGREYTALGGMIAAGHRWGRLTLDAEYGYVELTERGPADTRYGVAHEIGVNVRVELVRLGSRMVGPNSMAAVYAEAGIGRQLRRGDPLGPDEPRRPILSSGSADRLAGGFGVMFDHRLEQPRGFPNRVGWQLGWRLLGSPRPSPDSYVTCRGADCAAAPAPTRPPRWGLGETSLLVSSSLAFTW